MSAEVLLFSCTEQFFGLGQRAFLSHLVVAGQQFCAEDWSKLTLKYASFREEDFLHYCFSSAYIVALLHDSLGIALNDQRYIYTVVINHLSFGMLLGIKRLEINIALS